MGKTVTWITEGKLILWETQQHDFWEKTEAVAQRCSVKKAFLEISQNSQENTCARASFFNNVKKKRETLGLRCFPMNFAEFLRTPYLTEHLWFWKNTWANCLWWIFFISWISFLGLICIIYRNIYSFTSII